MRENTLRTAPLDGLSITLTWSIPENPPSQGPEDFFSNYQGLSLFGVGGSVRW